MARQTSPKSRQVDDVIAVIRTCGRCGFDFISRQGPGERVCRACSRRAVEGAVDIHKTAARLPENME